MTGHYHITPLDPPFGKDVLKSLKPDGEHQDMRRNPGLALKQLLPASYRENNDIVKVPTTNLFDMLRQELSVKRLNRIHNYLWLAGRPMPPRPLNYQIATSRQIVVDERLDMHMVWEKPRRIFFKPIPRYLLSNAFWKEYLCCEDGLAECREEGTCPRLEVYRCAMGFLLSYTALIQYECDFHIAQGHHLLPEEIKWNEWVALVEELLDRTNLKNIDRRYWFGELRLSRLNKIYFFLLCEWRGYKFPYQTYSELFHDYFGLLAGTTIYIALVLTAMQVGLGTDTLRSNTTFQNASYGFTVFSILGPLILVLLIFVISLVIFVCNMRETLDKRKKRFAELLPLSRGHMP
ncbi:hypothetical protein ASPCAL11772 [Aspergillus calidoustus]|uniref:Subtilisin-like serine protease n=1 Tax=Aspergillus calidoustus TaxID=454130 RepID=A0A0U5GA31_ASPCI|nr:hypothetical protein ASPCAL11772 [Aspergillus calidoustus]